MVLGTSLAGYLATMLVGRNKLVGFQVQLGDQYKLTSICYSGLPCHSRLHVNRALHYNIPLLRDWQQSGKHRRRGLYLPHDPRVRTLSDGCHAVKVYSLERKLSWQNSEAMQLGLTALLLYTAPNYILESTALLVYLYPSLLCSFGAASSQELPGRRLHQSALSTT